MTRKSYAKSIVVMNGRRTKDRHGQLAIRQQELSTASSCSIRHVSTSNLVGTTSVETDRLLTDADFRVIRRLKKRALEARDAEDEEQGEGLAMHMPNFDFMEERERLKRMTEAMREEELNYDDGEGEDEDADDEMDGEEEEELDFEGGEIIEEDEFEGDEEML